MYKSTNRSVARADRDHLAGEIGGFGYLILMVAIAATASCSSSGSSGPSRIVRGDTTIVRSGGAGEWTSPMTYEVDLSIGRDDGPEELMIGSISYIAVDDAGGIYAFDRTVPALRYYNAQGEYVRTLGGEGSGPGEYQDTVLGLAVLSDGRIVLRDPRNGRLNIYGPDGTAADQWTFASGLYTSQAMFVDDRDHIYCKILLGRPEPNQPWHIGLLHMDNTGAVLDTIPDPVMPGKNVGTGGTFLPRLLWTWSPREEMVVGFADTYSFEIREPDGKVIRVERAYDPVEVGSEERAEREAVNDWYRKYQAQSLTSELPPVPDEKPPYKALLADEDGRIWVQLYTPAVKRTDIEPREGNEQAPPSVLWREPEVYDVFSPDGTYLGRVNVPQHVSLELMRGDLAWGVQTGEMGEPHIVRMRMVPDRGANESGQST